jgi:hypothetical protein
VRNNFINVNQELIISPTYHMKVSIALNTPIISQNLTLLKEIVICEIKIKLFILWSTFKL